MEKRNNTTFILFIHSWFVNKVNTKETNPRHKYKNNNNKSTKIIKFNGYKTRKDLKKYVKIVLK